VRANDTIFLSAATGQGLDALLERISQVVVFRRPTSGAPAGAEDVLDAAMLDGVLNEVLTDVRGEDGVATGALDG
jgi:hypothetical protein